MRSARCGARRNLVQWLELGPLERGDLRGGIRHALWIELAPGRAFGHDRRRRDTLDEQRLTAEGLSECRRGVRRA